MQLGRTKLWSLNIWLSMSRFILVMVVLNQMQCSWSALVSLLQDSQNRASVEVPGPGMPVPLASSGILLTLSSINSSSLAIVKCTEIPDFNSYICLHQNLLLGWNWTGCVLLLYFCPECFCLCMKAWWGASMQYLWWCGLEEPMAPGGTSGHCWQQGASWAGSRAAGQAQRE